MPTSNNPELEFYLQRLLQRRRYYPIYGLLALITGVLGLFGIVSSYLSNPLALFALNQPGNLLHLLLLLCFLVAISSGLFFILRAFKQPGIKEVQNYRQSERRRLFLQAHGHALPWWSRLITRIIIIIIAGVFMVGGIIIFTIFGLSAIDGWFYLLVGSFVLSIAIYFIPREIRKLPSISAEQLAQNWLAGETTTSDDLPSQ